MVFDERSDRYIEYIDISKSVRTSISSCKNHNFITYFYNHFKLYQIFSSKFPKFKCSCSITKIRLQISSGCLAKEILRRLSSGRALFSSGMPPVTRLWKLRSFKTLSTTRNGANCLQTGVRVLLNFGILLRYENKKLAYG